jgi:hypothetical protein
MLLLFPYPKKLLIQTLSAYHYKESVAAWGDITAPWTDGDLVSRISGMSYVWSHIGFQRDITS